MSEPPRSLDAWVAWLEADRAHGAAALGREALRAVAQLADTIAAETTPELHAALTGAADRLSAARPSMAPPRALLQRWLNALPDSADTPLADARSAAIAHAVALRADASTASDHASAHAARLLAGSRGDLTMITHSYSSCVLGTLERLRDQLERVIVTESRPLNEGHQVARRLTDHGIAVTLITDAQMGDAVATADAALVGADTLLADGSVVNKSGTQLLALAARACEVPFYVCCESFKQSDAVAVELESMPPDELGAPDLPHLTVQNRYFDVTPANLVSGWIDEIGFRPNA